MDLKKILKNEYVYSIFTRGITIIISLIHSIIIARYLGAALKGTSTYIQSITSIASIIITFGMHQAYPFFRKKYGKEKILQDYLTIICILFAFYLAVAFFIGFFLISNIDLRFAILLTPLLGYSNVMSYICLVEEPNKRNSWWTIASLGNLLFCFVLFIFTKSNYSWAIVILLFEDLVKCIVYTISVKPRLKLHKGLLKLSLELFGMGFFPMIALLMTTLNYKIDVFMLRHFDFISDAQIGVYSIGMLFTDKIALIPDTLKGVLVSKLSKGADEDEVAKVSRICFWTTIGVCIVFLLMGNKVISLLYGKEYNGAFDILMICSFGTIFIGYFKLIAQYNIVNKKQIRNVLLLSFSVIVNVILNRILIPKYQLNGAAFASGVGYMLSGIIFVIWFAVQNNIKISKMILLQKSDLIFINNIIKRINK